MNEPIFLNLFYILALLGNVIICNHENNIIVIKKNVTHIFVPFDERTNNFVKYVFSEWENETFQLFESIKDPQGIAIDLGAWIGTTAIWLSKNFYHVIAVDGDKVSIKCLIENLKASECSNVTVCENPIGKNNEDVIFGPRFGRLNESTSSILTLHDYQLRAEIFKNLDYARHDDFTIEALTFKQLIHKYVYANTNLASRNVSFIKCDIEGGEEDILEDILSFAYANKSKVYVSFHLSWWKSKKIIDFESIFNKFKTDCPESNVFEYIEKNPFTSLLFAPITL
jgi:FkbM family methyltransferase